MKDSFLNELENQINIHDVPNKEEIMEKYRKRYDFGLEAGLSPEKIEEMLGDPREIIKEYLNPEEKKEEYAELVDRYELDVSTISDDIEFVYSKDSEVHVEFIDVELECYEVEKTAVKLKIAFLKRKFFSLNRRKSGTIRIEIPRDKVFQRMTVGTTSGDITLPVVKAEQIQLSTISGDCEFKTLEAPDISCTVVSGDITGENVKTRNISLSTISGDISIEFLVSETTKIDTVSGDVSIEEAKGNVSSTSVSGEVRVNGEETGLNVKSYVKGMFRDEK